ncbi:MAG TPA: hypothetical protein VNM68_04920, partial [Candidatus Polarisedimenticolia bacterium]|nr:hypothetical protein [Candidatus Polarisedimenticolia bacterium]
SPDESGCGLWRLVGRVILDAVLLTLSGSTHLLAQVSPHPEQAFSECQHDLETVVDTLLADARSEPLHLRPRPVIPAVAATPSG